MELDFSNNKITFQKKLNDLDTFVLEFTQILNKLHLKYVLISGYVAILFGRSRSSEDVDLFLEPLTFEKFSKLWDALLDSFECLNTTDKDEAYREYLKNGSALRFCIPGRYVPNMEVKFCKTNLDYLALKDRIEVVLNGHQLFVSPIEQQIAYKLYLGSVKDLEDADYLAMTFKDKINPTLMKQIKRKLKIGGNLQGYL